MVPWFLITLSYVPAHALRIHVITSINDSKSDAAENVFEATVQPMKTLAELLFIQTSQKDVVISFLLDFLIERFSMVLTTY